MSKTAPFQKTLRSVVNLEGIALHSGENVRLTLHPAPVGYGIRFVRTDLKGSAEIPALFSTVVGTRLATTLGRDRATVSTVEHLLAALAGLGIDNARVECSGPELPILDGSSRLFVEAIERTGIETQAQERAILAIRRRVELQLQEKWAVVEPSSRLEIHGSIEWDHPAIGHQEFHYVDGKTPFSEISAARTFCLLRDVEMMKQAGLAKGGSLENAVVVDEARVINPGGLRYADEFVRHKVLDALGDLKLAGLVIQGYFRLHRAGHDVHSQLLKAIFANPDNYEIIEHTPRGEPQVAVASGRVAALARGWAASF